MAGGTWLHENAVALIGFSYFVFRAIDYLHIQIISKSSFFNTWELFFYFLFPPTITSGPIHKYIDFRQQVINPIPLSNFNYHRRSLSYNARLFSESSSGRRY